MISVKSNIKGFLENYRKKAQKFEVFIENVAEKLAQKMIEFMRQDIKDKFYTWFEYGSYAEIFEFDNISFDIIPTNENSVRIEIGKNLPLFIMSDGTYVNPAFFIEFGFGIIGQNNPMKNHEAFDWEYNIHGHTKGWTYFGRDGKFHGSKGKKGINFMYNAQQKTKEFLIEIIKEQANG